MYKFKNGVFLEFVFYKLLFIVCVSFGINFFLIKFKFVIPLLDIPNERSSHQNIIPRSGGIAIFIAFCVGIFLFDLKHDYWFCLPLTMVFFLGLWDDFESLSSRKKLLITLVCSGMLYFLGFDIQKFGNFLGTEIIFPFWISFIFFSFACAGFVNALNLVDGLDGLASLISLVILISFTYLGFKLGDYFLLYISASLICAILGFLVFNWHPAKIFMGDSGSLTLGFLIVIIAVYAIKKEYVTAVSVLLLAAIPILDTLTVMVRRILNGHNPFCADKTHIHHILLRQQNNRTVRTVVIMGAWQLLFSYIGLGFKVRDDLYILILFCLCATVFYFSFTPKKRK
ncbi:MAG: undecaprenyl/decaprenyl-phosphate alpha-N-acetylglucosaminyl 1-phosphate transferase [Erysipelotrichia bacterium]|nr:undecaprenyl/decaprenyl-phosphate alpha-N-acetylglucosaminyl 1-phosphate transferase [Erysipelotrichia bacterium]